MLIVPILIALGPLLAAQPDQRDYKRWLNQEVNWIISRAERKAFRQLNDNASRERFIEQFWADRDPTLGTPRNEYQEQHYQRLKFSSEQFAEVGPGWRSDRGRVYIIHGPPLSRSIEAEREIWTYNSNPYAVYYQGPITLVFERSSSAFKERLISESRYAQQKAEERPGGQPHPLQQVRSTPRFRLLAAGPGYRPQLVLTAGETDRYIADILRSPGEVLEERKREDQDRKQRLQQLRTQIESRVSFERLPVELETFFFPVPHKPEVVLSLTLNREDVAAERRAAGGPARFDLYCQAVETTSDYLVDAFDAGLSAPAEGELSDLTYTDLFVLPEGHHRVSCVIRGLASGRTGKKEATLPVPSPLDHLTLARPILTQHIEKVAHQEEFDPLILQDTRFSPQKRHFDAQRPVYLLFHVFSNSPPSRRLTFDYQIHTRDRVFYRSPARVLPVGSNSSPTPYALALDLSGLKAGQYFLMLKVQDSEQPEYALEEVSFVLSPAS